MTPTWSSSSWWPFSSPLWRRGWKTRAPPKSTSVGLLPKWSSKPVIWISFCIQERMKLAKLGWTLPLPSPFSLIVQPRIIFLYATFKGSLRRIKWESWICYRALNISASARRIWEAKHSSLPNINALFFYSNSIFSSFSTKLICFKFDERR